MANRCLTYEEFLQTPADFVDDVVDIIRAKEKWGLDLTNDEKTLKNYVIRMHIKVLGEHLNLTTQQNQ
jgi:RecB family endonuclease NucS